MKKFYPRGEIVRENEPPDDKKVSIYFVTLQHLPGLNTLRKWQTDSIDLLPTQHS